MGRLTEDKALLIVAAQEDGKGIGRIRMRHVPDLTKATLHGFIAQSIEPGSVVVTDGLSACWRLKRINKLGGLQRREHCQ